MSAKRRVVLQSNQNIIVEFTDERIIPAGGLAVVGALLGKSDFIKKMNRMDVTPNRSQHQIKNGDILLTYLGMLCMGNRSLKLCTRWTRTKRIIRQPWESRGASPPKKRCGREWTT